jgi:hypothetical protein
LLVVVVVLSGDETGSGWVPRCEECLWRGTRQPEDELGALDAEAEARTHAC